MERAVLKLRRRRLLLAAAAFGLAPRLRAAERQLVIVASAQSPIRALSPAEVRRLYLGVPVTVDGKEIEPLRNTVDSATQELFLQRVLFMSLHAYERQLAAHVYRTGGNAMRQFTSLDALLAALNGNPLAVSYMPLEQVAKVPGLKIVTGL
jgi:hypothetical protein